MTGRGPAHFPPILAPAVVVFLAALPAATAQRDPIESTADAVILEESLEIDVRSASEARVHYYNRTEILTPEGAERYAAAAIFHAPGVEIEKVKAQSYTPEGRMVKVKRSDIFDQAFFPGFVLYSDSMVRVVPFRGIGPGTTIEYEYDLSVTNLDYLEDTCYFQAVIPIRRKTLTVRSPADFPLRIASKGPGIKHSERVEDGDVVRRWSATNVPPIEDLPHTPPDVDLFPRVTFVPERFMWDSIPVDSSSWNGIASFNRALYEGRSTPSPAVAAKARELTEGATDPDEKLRRIFEFVRDSVNYVAISLDIGGWQPHDNGSVLANLYGDCKDKATLAIAMLDAVGLEGLPVLLRTRDAGRIDRDNPSLDFNHAILAVPQEAGYLFLDPTAEFVPFGDLPWVDQGVTALVVRGDGRGDLVEIPLSTAERNRRKIRFEGSVDAAGHLSGDLVLHVWGQEREIYHFLRRDSSRELEDRLTSVLSSLVPGALLEEPRIDAPAGWDEPVRVWARISMPRYVTRAASVEVLPPSPVRFPPLSSAVTLSERSLPVFLEHPFSEEIESRLWLPDGREVGDLPEARTASGPGLEAKISYEMVEDGKRRALVTRRAVSVGKREYSVEEYPSLRAFVRSLQEDAARAVALRRPM